MVAKREMAERTRNSPRIDMAAKALILSNPAPTRQEIAEWLSGNICRCGAYPAIVASIQEAAAEMAAREPRR